MIYTFANTLNQYTMAYQVIDIANKILYKATTNAEVEGLICNLKLQKMLYYMQGFYLAYFGKSLFEEDIEAWMYGPVVPSIYETFKSNGNRGIEYSGNTISLQEEEEELFDEVYRVYNEYSAVGLMNLTHTETPWKSVTTGVGNIIEKDAMKSFFKKRIDG